MNDREYRVRIVAREKENSDTLYIVETDILPIKDGVRIAAGQKPPTWRATPSEISIPELINRVKIYDYDMRKRGVYAPGEIKDKAAAENKAATHSGKTSIKRFETAKEAIENNIIKVGNMPGEEFAKGEKRLSEQVSDYFNTLGNVAHNDITGDVELGYDTKFNRKSREYDIVVLAAPITIGEEGYVMGGGKC